MISKAKKKYLMKSSHCVLTTILTLMNYWRWVRTETESNENIHSHNSITELWLWGCCLHSPTTFLQSEKPSNTPILQCLLKAMHSTGPSWNVSSSGQNFCSCPHILTTCPSASLCLDLQLEVKCQIPSLGGNHCGPQYESNVLVLEETKVRELHILLYLNSTRSWTL